MVNVSFGNYAVDMRLDDVGTPWAAYIDRITPSVTSYGSSFVNLVINPFNIQIHATGSFAWTTTMSGVQFLGSSTLDGVTVTYSGQPILSVTGLPPVSFDTIQHLSSVDDLLALYSGVSLNVMGSPYNDYLVGENAADMLSGGNGNDTLDGGPGSDMLDGGAGNDTFIVDSGGDMIADSSGMDTVQSYIPWMLQAGLENLTLLGSASYGVGNSADNVLIGNAADNPLLRGAGGNDTILGGAGNDWIEGDDSGDGAISGNDLLAGEDGNDTILGGPGDDQIFGGDGVDVLVGETGNDLIYGDAGTDYLDGRAGSDQLFGGDGNDVIYGDGLTSTYGSGSDTIHGGAGDDTLMGESGDHFTGGALDIIYGDEGNDSIYGGAGNDWIFGGDGNDSIDGGEGSDYIVGGPGVDTMLGSGASAYSAATSGGDLFAYMSLADGGDTIYGFDLNMGTANDGIDLRPLFDTLGITTNTPRAPSDGGPFLYVYQNAADAQVYVDPTGSPDGPQNMVLLFTLHGVSASSLTDSYFLFQ